MIKFEEIYIKIKEDGGFQLSERNLRWFRSLSKLSSGIDQVALIPNQEGETLLIHLLSGNTIPLATRRNGEWYSKL